MSSRIVWRSPLHPDGGYADWVRELRGKNGVYLIRALDGEVLYVGESHSGRLYDTMTRHLQNWSGFGSGPSYHPGRVTVAALELGAADVLEEQYELIAQYEPRDNQQDGRSLFKRVAGDDEDAPF